MGPIKTLCGVAAALLILSGCGSSSGSPSAAATGDPSGATGSSGSSSGSTTSGGGGSSGGSGSGSTGSATLSWTAPTANTNGSALTDLAGYHIYYGTAAGSLSSEIDVGNPGTLTYTVTQLSAGTWYFAVTAYTNTGLESSKSQIGSKTIS